MPEPAAKCVSDGVRELSAYTAGGRVCFATDSDFVAISCRRPGLWLMPHMALAGSGGFDLYVREAGKTAYYGTFMPDPKKKEGYDSILSFPTKKMRELVIHFPLYCGITSLAVGLERERRCALGTATASASPSYFTVPPLQKAPVLPHPVTTILADSRDASASITSISAFPATRRASPR